MITPPGESRKVNFLSEILYPWDAFGSLRASDVKRYGVRSILAEPTAKAQCPSYDVQRDRRAARRIVSFFAPDASWLAILAGTDRNRATGSCSLPAVDIRGKTALRMALPATKMSVKIQRSYPRPAD
jgi:hypothetical protein